MIATDKLKNVGKIPVFPCTIGWDNYVPTGAGQSQNTTLVLGSEDGTSLWNSVAPKMLNNFQIYTYNDSAGVITPGVYSKFILRLDAATQYLEFSTNPDGGNYEKAVFINLNDVDLTGATDDIYIQLRKIEFIKTGYYYGGDQSIKIDKYSAWVLCSDPQLEETLTLFTLEESQKTDCAGTSTLSGNG